MTTRKTAAKRAAATLAILTLAATLLTGCTDDGQADDNPCGNTGKPWTGDSGGVGTFDGVQQAFVTKLGGGGNGGKNSGGGKDSGTSKSDTGTGKTTSGGGSSNSGGSSKSWFGGSSNTTKSTSASTAFRNSTVTGSRTFTAANGTKYAVAPRLTLPPRNSMYYIAPPPTSFYPGMHYNYLRWAMYGNYPGATRIIECR